MHSVHSVVVGNAIIPFEIIRSKQLTWIIQFTYGHARRCDVIEWFTSMVLYSGAPQSTAYDICCRKFVEGKSNQLMIVDTSCKNGLARRCKTEKMRCFELTYVKKSKDCYKLTTTLNNVVLSTLNNVVLSTLNNVVLSTLNNVVLSTLNNVVLSTLNNVVLSTLNNVALSTLSNVVLCCVVHNGKQYLLRDINGACNTMTPLTCSSSSQSTRPCLKYFQPFEMGRYSCSFSKQPRDPTKCPRIAWCSTRGSTGLYIAKPYRWFQWNR